MGAGQSASSDSTDDTQSKKPRFQSVEDIMRGPPVPMGTPEFLPDPVNRPDIKIVQKGFFKERSAKNIPPHLTMTLPKGTLLFRGIREVKSKQYDFQGVFDSDDYSKRCLAPHFQVFFYPYPYTIDTIVGVASSSSAMMVYVTTRDIEIVCLVNPSKYTRYSTKENIIKMCWEIDPFGCKLKGNGIDPCLTEDYRETFPDVTGIIAIEQSDALRQRSYLRNKNNVDKAFVRFMGTQVGMITDASVTSPFTKQNEIGVPEIVLRPMYRSMKDSYTTQNSDYATFVEKNKDVLNYREFATLERGEGDETKVEDFMERLLSSEGYNGYHAAIDKQTGFYRVKELSAPFESTATVVRKNEPAFVFRRNPDFTEMYGRSRRKTRRGKRKPTGFPRL